MENKNLNVQCYECHWIITKFSGRFSDYENRGEAHSMIFSTGSDEPVDWHFRLYSDETSASLIFEIMNDESPNYWVKSQQSCLHILNAHGEKVELIGTPQFSKISAADKNWTVYKFAKNILFDNANLFLPNNVLAIICKVRVILNSPSILHQCCQTLNNGKNNSQTQFDDDESCDVTIVVNGKEFRARKVLLTKYSPVFEAMFRYDMKEKNENRVVISDIEPEIFVGVLEFIYTNQVTNIDKIAIGLLAAADKYAMDELKQLCQQSLFRTITIDNIEEIVMLADRYNAQQLIQYYTKYFINPPLVKIINYCDSYFDKYKR